MRTAMLHDAVGEEILLKVRTEFGMQTEKHHNIMQKSDSSCVKPFEAIRLVG